MHGPIVSPARDLHTSTVNKYSLYHKYTIQEIKAHCPDTIHLPSDYETYSLFSQRIFAVVRRYTPDVEEYSIDECFCDLTGLRRPLRMAYEAMAARSKADLKHDLGLTFVVGLAPTKVVAKIASKWQKPTGLRDHPDGGLGVRNVEDSGSDR